VSVAGSPGTPTWDARSSLSWPNGNATNSRRITTASVSTSHGRRQGHAPRVARPRSALGPDRGRPPPGGALFPVECDLHGPANVQYLHARETLVVPLDERSRCILGTRATDHVTHRVNGVELQPDEHVRAAFPAGIVQQSRGDEIVDSTGSARRVSRSSEIGVLLRENNHEAFEAAVRANPRRATRYLVGRLCSADPTEKWRAVHALGDLARDPSLMPAEQLEDLLRRFLWALNDESGAVPFGIPEAMAEVLAARPDLHATYIPVLGSCLDSDDLSQVGVIEQGVIWGLGRLGRATAQYAPDAIEVLRQVASNHPDLDTRRLAEQALRAIQA
jgi:hypothetical protein